VGFEDHIDGQRLTSTAFANLIQVFRNLSQGRPAGDGKEDRTTLELDANTGRYKRPFGVFTHNNLAPEAQH